MLDNVGCLHCPALAECPSAFFLALWFGVASPVLLCSILFFTYELIVYDNVYDVNTPI